jgi:hypothetical protein
MRDYTLDLFEYGPLLKYLNDPSAQPTNMRAKLVDCATQALQRPLSKTFILWFRCQTQRIFDQCSIGLRIPANIVVQRNSRNAISQGWVLRPRSPQLDFNPGYAAHFYYFACLISNPAGLARFSKCGACGKFFIRERRLQSGRCFCSDKCRQRFHAARPERRKANSEAVKRLRFHERFFRFIEENRSLKCSWDLKMQAWNEQSAGRSKARQFRRDAIFKKAWRETEAWYKKKCIKASASHKNALL